MAEWTARYDYPTADEVKGMTAGELSTFLAERYHLVGHPKAGLLFNLAWEEGHSSGQHEVAGYYVEFAALLDPNEGRAI